MSKGSEFLPEVLGLIEKRLGEIDENIQAVRQDINSMNEYYWDNYTEMDQYGYEDYDNQQALKMQDVYRYNLFVLEIHVTVFLFVCSILTILNF